MKKIISESESKFQLSKLDKKELAYLIRRVGYLPEELRPKLWKLASGGERMKQNNPGYYFIHPTEEA